MKKKPVTKIRLGFYIVSTIYGPRKDIEIVIEAPIQLESLLINVGLDLNDIGFVMCDGNIVSLKDNIVNGQTIDVFSIFSGG